MATRSSKRRRLNIGTTNNKSAPAAPKVFPNEPSAAATDADKRNWKGWCEIESEPAFFNVMLKELGVSGVKVREVVSLDEEMLGLLPRPVYGLIFLYKWKEDDPSQQETTCPPNVWFANQVVSNACASFALLNILNNIPDVELGENLRAFKEHTGSFTPALRGYAISNFEFVQQIHNSFARKSDMLNGDLHVKNEATAAKSRSKEKAKDEHESNAFHFIAFVPIDGKLWKLDGLERQPYNLGTVDTEDWIHQVKLDIEARMAKYDDGQIEFAILSLVKDPLIGLRRELAQNVKGIQALQKRLTEITPDWEVLITAATAERGPFLEGTITGPNPGYLLEAEDIESASIHQYAHDSFSSDNILDLVKTLENTAVSQMPLRASIMEEQEVNQADEDKAAARRFDYGPAVQTWLRFLARKSASETILNSE